MINQNIKDCNVTAQSVVKKESFKIPDSVMSSKELMDRGVPRFLRDYQEHALDRSCGVPGFVLGHDMGTGKTFTALKYMLERNIRIVLISCPKSVLDVWPIEIEKFRNLFLKFYNVKYNVIILDDIGVEKKAKTLISEVKKAAAKKEPVIVIVNYDSIWRSPLGMTVEDKKITSLGRLAEIKWQLHIMDEAHRLKDSSSKASIYCYQLNKKIPFRLALSGTPMPHSPLDLYGILRAIDPSILGISYYQFKAKYAKYIDCGGFKKFVGMQNSNELLSLINRYIDIVSSNDVLSLPETQHIARYVRLGVKAQKIYNELESKFYSEVEEGKVSVSIALVKMLRLSQITGGSVPFDEETEASKIIDTAKEDALDDIIKDLPEDEPIIVFCRFKHEIEMIKRVFEKNKRSYGQMNSQGNDYLDFLNEKINSLAVQIRSGGVGVNFTRARYNIYINTGLSLGDYKQSLKRSHRSGQDRSVFYYHIIAKGTIDEDTYKNLDSKEELVVSIMNGIKRKILEKKKRF